MRTTRLFRRCERKHSSIPSSPSPTGPSGTGRRSRQLNEATTCDADPSEVYILGREASSGDRLTLAMSRFGENFARVLGLHALTGRQAARLLGVSEQAVSEWLTGKREPGTSSLVRITSSFEVDALRLMNEPFTTMLPQLADPDRFDRVEKRLNGLEWVTDERGYGHLKPGVRAKSSTVTELTKRRR